MPDSDLSYELAHWYESSTGEELRNRLIEAMPQILSGVPGIHHAQVAIGDWPSLYKKARQLDYHEVFAADAPPDLQPNSLDSLLLVHALDASSDPHRILHIADKLVAHSGYLIIVGFNPYSLWGLLRFPMWLSHRSPWRTGFYSYWRLRDWLRVLNYEVRLQTSLVQLPPLPSRGWYHWLKWLDVGLHWLIPNWGAINIIVAKRPLYPMTGVREFTATEHISPGVLAGPTTRSLRKGSE